MAAPAPCGTAWAGKSGATFDSTRRQSQFAHSKWPDAVITEHYMSDRAVPGVGCVVDGGRKGEIGSASFYQLSFYTKTECRSPQGTTPLMDVCGRQFDPETEKLVALLLFNKADTYLKDAQGRDAVAYAEMAGNDETVKLIKQFREHIKREEMKTYTPVGRCSP